MLNAARGTRTNRKGRAQTRWTVRSLIAAAGLAAVMATTTPASAAQVTAAERLALSARVLQTELMVAALTCDDHASYNAFVHKFQAQLVAHGRTLRALFHHHFGAAGTNRLTTFVTALANQAALRSAQAGAGYCVRAEKLFASTLAVPTGKDFSQFIKRQPFADSHNIDTVLNAAVRRVAESMTADAAPTVVEADNR